MKLASGSNLKVSGWALDGAEVTSVEVQLDGQTLATLPVDVARPDVCAMYPMYAGCPAPGFSGNVSLGSAAPCQVLRLVAKDADGNSQILGERLITP